jgi:dienelactone hydrolase
MLSRCPRESHNRLAVEELSNVDCRDRLPVVEIAANAPGFWNSEIRSSYVGKMGRFSGSTAYIAAVMITGVAAPFVRSESASATPTLPDTRPLDLDGDLALRMVAGIDQFLLRELAASVASRARHWRRDFSSSESYRRSVAPNRARLARIVGAHEPRIAFDAPELVATTTRAALVGKSEKFDIYSVRWPVIRNVTGEGLLLVPRRSRVADVIAIPDADQTPEQLCGLADGIASESQFARRLAASGCRVLVPVLVDRATTFSSTVAGERQTGLSHREFLYRPAFEMGRHIIGYELKKVFGAVDWFRREALNRDARIGVIGYGEGGLLALYAAAIDTRIDAAAVCGYFEPRENVWQEPIYRNVFGLLEQFGDAELASLVAPRPLIIEACHGPEVVVPPGTRGGPGRLTTADPKRIEAELDRARRLTIGLSPAPQLELVINADGNGPFGTPAVLEKFLNALVPPVKLEDANPPKSIATLDDPKSRLRRQIRQIEEDTQFLLAESPYTRQKFWAKADRQSRSVDKWKQSTEWYRDYFYNEVIGRFERQRLTANPRSRKVFEEPTYAGYEVVLDVFPDVIAYGILLLPKDIKPGERRPVVVCQHGLEGRPTDVASPKIENPAYHRYACRLAERGFITYAPQNPYIFQDRFRTLQRKLNPLKKTLFSVIVPQHEQTVDWLASLPFVDPDRIGFYGLSYGGKTAMRVPALVERYALSICSADFNEWIWKNASTRSPYSYVATGEYEIFEFNLGETFNYAEMAGLIAPRPFMVERGHRDGVAPDETVAYEFAKVRLLYADLKIPDRTEIEFFDGPHTIHGVGTFEFLHNHLHWPKPPLPSR